MRRTYREASGRPRIDRRHLVARENPCAVALGQTCEGPRREHGVGLRAASGVHRTEERRLELSLDAQRFTDAEQLHLVRSRAKRGDPVAHEVRVLRGRDRLDPARLPEFDVESMVELHVLEQLHASCCEMRLQVRSVSPADRLDLARIDARRSGRNLAALEERDTTSVRSEVERAGGSRDPAADHDDFRVSSSHAARYIRYMMWST